MFGHEKKEKVISPKKQLRIEHKKAKIELKKQTKADRAAKEVEQVAASAGKNAISRLAIAGSRIVGSAVAFLGAASYQSFVASGISSHLTLMYSGATVGASLLAAAPYAKSVSRTNKQLSAVDSKLVQVDAAIGSQQQLVSEAIAGLEQAAQKPSISAEDIADIRAKLNAVHSKLSGEEPVAEPSIESPARPNVHVATKAGSNHVAK